MNTFRELKCIRKSKSFHTAINSLNKFVDIAIETETTAIEVAQSSHILALGLAMLCSMPIGKTHIRPLYKNGIMRRYLPSSALKYAMVIAL